MSFGELLRQFRTRRSVGLREMAAECARDASNYANLELGKLGPPNSKERVLKLVEPLALAEDEVEQLISAAYEWHLAKLNKRFK